MYNKFILQPFHSSWIFHLIYLQVPVFRFWSTPTHWNSTQSSSSSSIRRKAKQSWNSKNRFSSQVEGAAGARKLSLLVLPSPPPVSSCSNLIRIRLWMERKLNSIWLVNNLSNHANSTPPACQLPLHTHSRKRWWNKSGLTSNFY